MCPSLAYASLSCNGDYPRVPLRSTQGFMPSLASRALIVSYWIFRPTGGCLHSLCELNLPMTQTEKTPLYAWYALALLMVVYILNFLDRTIIYILFPLIKKEMEFSDTQLALLGTTSFVIFYTLLGIPFGRMADKGSRTKIIAIGVIIWSLFSGLTAFAGGFWTLFFCRVMVGVGEATLGPAAISLLSDFFPPVRRATVTSIYSMVIAVGAGLAAFLGGNLNQFG